MKLRRLLIALIALTLLPFGFKVYGQDFGKSMSLFSDMKANQIGDNLTVLIYEMTNASNKSETKNEEGSSASAGGGPGTGVLDFIPLFGVSGESSNSYDGKGEVKKNQSLRAKMTVTVVGIKHNGDLIIEGSRTVGIGQNTETMHLTGVVRQKDVAGDNTVDSYLIADAKIAYDGEGPSQNSARPGIVSRLFSWLF